MVIAATWAASHFVLDENKVNLYKAQVSNEQAVNRQLEAKISVLESRIVELSNNNKQLLSWVSETPSSFPALKNKITKLEARLASVPNVQKIAEINKTEADKKYRYSEEFVKGQSFTDPLTNATIGVSDVSIDRTAKIYLYIPGLEGDEINDVKPGTSWAYRFKGKEYHLTLNTIEWIGSYLKATVTEIDK